MGLMEDMSGGSIVRHRGVPRLSVSMDRTINLGNYENVKLGVGLMMDAEGENPEAIAKQFSAMENRCWVELNKLEKHVLDKKGGGQ